MRQPPESERQDEPGSPALTPPLFRGRGDDSSTITSFSSTIGGERGIIGTSAFSPDDPRRSCVFQNLTHRCSFAVRVFHRIVCHPGAAGVRSPPCISVFLGRRHGGAGPRRAVSFRRGRPCGDGRRARAGRAGPRLQPAAQPRRRVDPVVIRRPGRQLYEPVGLGELLIRYDSVHHRSALARRLRPQVSRLRRSGGRFHG